MRGCGVRLALQLLAGCEVIPEPKESPCNSFVLMVSTEQRVLLKWVVGSIYIFSWATLIYYLFNHVLTIIIFYKSFVTKCLGSYCNTFSQFNIISHLKKSRLHLYVLREQLCIHFNSETGLSSSSTSLQSKIWKTSRVSKVVYWVSTQWLLQRNARGLRAALVITKKVEASADKVELHLLATQHVLLSMLSLCKQLNFGWEKYKGQPRISNIAHFFTLTTISSSQIFLRENTV